MNPMLISPGPKENRDCPFGVCTDIEKVPEPERVIEAAVEEEDSPYSVGGSSKEVGGRSGNDNSNILIFPGFEGDQVKWVPTCQKLEKDLAQGRKDGRKGILNTDLEMLCIPKDLLPFISSKLTPSSGGSVSKGI